MYPTAGEFSQIILLTLPQKPFAFFYYLSHQKNLISMDLFKLLNILKMNITKMKNL